MIAWMPLTICGSVVMANGVEVGFPGSIMIGAVSTAIWTLIFGITTAPLGHALKRYDFGTGLLIVSLIMGEAVIPDSLPVHYYSGLSIFLYLVIGLSFHVFSLIFLIHGVIRRMSDGALLSSRVGK